MSTVSSRLGEVMNVTSGSVVFLGDRFSNTLSQDNTRIKQKLLSCDLFRDLEIHSGINILS